MAKALHEQAAEYIRARIQSGEYALGSRIPTENELCALLGSAGPPCARRWIPSPGKGSSPGSKGGAPL